jgi:hypothetical protein
MTRRRFVVATLAVACVAGALAARSQPQTAQPALHTLPCVQWYGPHSAINAPAFVRIVDQSTWDELWARHRAEKIELNLRNWPVVPLVDFDRHMIIASFGGDDSVNDGEQVQQVFRDGDALVIRFASLTFQTAVIDPDADLRPLTCTPYGIWVVERHAGPVRIEQDKDRLLTEPPNWVEVHTFDALER